MFTSILIILSSSFVVVLSYDVTTLNTPKLIVGSSPYFDDCTNSLYFSDAYGQKYSIFRYDFKEEVCYYAEIPGETSAGSITPIKGSRTRFIVGVGGGFKIIKWNGISKLVKVIETIDARRNKNSPANIMVDSMVDMTGRLYNGDQTPAVCDFSQPANASLYTYKKGEGVVKRLHHLRLANAPTFNQKEKKCYFTDACAFDIKEFEWDPDTGDLRNGRRVFDFRKHGRLPPYLPNGITIDLDGNLYEPLYNKGQIFKIDPRTSEVLQKIQLPTGGPLNNKFGGCNRDILFVTTGLEMFDIWSGSAIGKNFTAPGGQVLMVTGLGVKGYRSKRACV